MNKWFHRHAWHNQLGGGSRTNVIDDPADRTIIGYVSISAGSIERQLVPRPQQRNQPDPLPAILLGQLAVDVRYQGRGYAKWLLRFALTTCVRLSKEVGCFGVKLHPLDDGLRNFYRRFGFSDLPDDPKHSMIARITDLERNGF